MKHERDTGPSSYPRWLEERETAAIVARRELARHDPAAPHVGLALSGGGIRSATFCLGVLQALARAGLLRRIDYMSTVSGGGYVGSFLGGLFVGSRREPAAPAVCRCDEVERGLTAVPDSFAVSWLRSNGRYLAPNGSGASWLAGAVLLRNWIAVLFVFALGALTLALLADGAHLGVNLLRERLPSGAFRKFCWAVGNDTSPLFPLAVVSFLGLMVPSGIAYWLVPVGRPGGMRWTVLLLGILCVGGLRIYGMRVGDFREPRGALVLVLGVVLASSVAFWLWARGWRTDVTGEARNLLSRALAAWLVVTLAILSIAVCDALGQALYVHVLDADSRRFFYGALGGAYAAGAAVALAGQRILAALGPLKKMRTQLLPMTLFLGAVAAVLLMGTLASLASHAIVWQGEPPYRVRGAVWNFAVATGCAAIAMFALSRFYRFVNQSSLASLYADRLTRAFLGASNERREAADRGPRDFRGPEPMDGDQIPLDRYHPHRYGGPLHPLNATVNETIDARVQVKQPDRHGLPIALGPCAVSVGVKHHAARRSDADGTTANGISLVLENPAAAGEPGVFQVFPPGRELVPEQMPLGTWMALSGAAVSTGLGARTHLGMSMLLAFFNMRLGHWWDSGIARDADRKAVPQRLVGRIVFSLARVLPIYGFLWGEMLARFPGTAARHWYVTDGGHFENTGCYELIRRGVPFIVCCDAGADPKYSFTDVGNLVRLARVDFGVEIEFLEGSDLDRLLAPDVRDHFGTLEQVKTQAWRAGSKEGAGTPPPRIHAALGRIRYRDGSEGRLVLLKPTLSGDEPQDVRGYGIAHPAFPQESTADQFFDDAQWEAYRRLGEHVAAGVFSPAAVDPARGWRPSHMTPA
ncbi:MAG TPA: hypothetical protein VGG39_23245 [Polyangiaceae bacterium]